jgi:hypothetical protein
MLRHRHRSAALPRIPTPEHEWRAHMLHNLLNRTVSVLLWVLEQFAKMAIVEALPNHWCGWGRQMPTGRSRRHMPAHEVVVLVTGAAFDRIDTVSVGPTANLHGMAMAIVSLARIVSVGVAIHAARVTEYGRKGFESGSGSVLPHHFLDLLCFGIFTPLGVRPQEEHNQQPTYWSDRNQSSATVTNAHARVPSCPRAASSIAALTRSGVNGKFRRRIPVASKIAFPMAAGAIVIAVSPAPVAGTPAGVTKTLSTVGAS